MPFPCQLEECLVQREHREDQEDLRLLLVLLLEVVQLGRPVAPEVEVLLELLKKKMSRVQRPQDPVLVERLQAEAASDIGQECASEHVQTAVRDDIEDRTTEPRVCFL